jgi:predicted kinase
VYAGLLERARPVVASGRTAILDGTFGTRAHRRNARAAADALNVGVRFVETRCPPALARERLARRAAAGADPSDAGPELHAQSLAGFETLEPEEGIAVDVVDSADPAWRDALARCVSAWGDARAG